MASPLAKFSRKIELTAQIPIVASRNGGPDFIVEARFLDGKEQQEMNEMCQTRNRTGFTELDNPRYRKVWCKKVIRGWSGLTPENLRFLLPRREIDENEEFRREFPDRQIPYGEETALIIYEESLAADFFLPLMDGLRKEADRRAEERAREGEDARKNSVSSSSSISGLGSPPSIPDGVPASTAKRTDPGIVPEGSSAPSAAMS